MHIHFPFSLFSRGFSLFDRGYQLQMSSGAVLHQLEKLRNGAAPFEENVHPYKEARAPRGGLIDLVLLAEGLDHFHQSHGLRAIDRGVIGCKMAHLRSPPSHGPVGWRPSGRTASLSTPLGRRTKWRRPR